MIFMGFCLGVSGCNVFGGGETPAETVPALLTDARIALTKGETSRAVSLLERAYRMDSSHVGVRIELSNALFADRRYDVFSLRAALQAFTGGDAKNSRASEKAVCSGGLDPERVRRQYRSVAIGGREDVQSVVEHEAVVNRVRDLLLRGVFDARSEILQQRADTPRMKAYLLGVLARIAGEIRTVVAAMQETGSTMHYASGTPAGRFVVCGPNKDAIARGIASLCAFETALDQSTTWLQQRNELAGSQQDVVLLAPIRTQSNALRASFGCGS